MEKQRIEYIDLAKGLCISLVVLYHIHCFETTTETALQFFRMPLYYFLSGIFFKEYGGLAIFSIKKVNKLIIPFLFFFLVAYAAGIVCHFLHFYERGIIEEPFHWNMIFDIFTKLGRGEDIGYNVPIWFLLSLFEANLLFYLLRTRIKNDKILLAVSFAIGILSVIAGLNKLPYCIDRTLIALPFFAVGYSLKTRLLNLGEIKKEKLFALAIVCFAVIYFLATLSKPVRDGFLVRYIAGFTGICMILSVSKALKKLPVFSYIGRYSIIVLGFHMFLMGPSRYLFSFASPVIQYILSFITITLAMRFAIIPISLKILPYFTAQKDLIPLPSRLRNRDQS